MANGERPTGLYTKIENSQGKYIQYNSSGTNGGSFRYYDALQIFKRKTTNSHQFNKYKIYTMNNTYYNVRDGVNNGYSTYEWSFKSELRQLGVSESEISNIWTYINDTLISSSTNAYPELSQFVLKDVDNPPSYTATVMGKPYLYTKSSDQSRCVDFGIKLRSNADLWLSKDIYKTTLLVNGKQQEYYYNKKKSETDAQGNWTINLNTGMYTFSAGSDSQNRASNSNYVGSTYTREIRKSEYLYDGSDSGTIDSKNLQVFVTYKIAIKNQSQDIWTSVDEIVDYYDSDQYHYDGNSTIIKNNTYVGDARGNKRYDLNVRTNTRYSSVGYNINGVNNYSSLYLTNVKSYNSGNNRLEPGELTYVYITFKVNNDSSGKVKLDQVMDDLINYSNGKTIRDTVGKRNIAEINGYSTYFNSYSSSKAGLIDLDSNCGSLRSMDLDSEGNIISSENSWENRLEDDTDKAANLKLKIDNDKNDTRSISGYVFEDARTEVSDGAVIGNGMYNESDSDFEGNKDKKINGVTIQLVELVPTVDGEGFNTGNYEKEHIWSSITYKNNWAVQEDTSRYYSGTNRSRVILSGQGVFKVDPVQLTEGNGQYRFDSLPPGDFFIRFIYGDTTQTVLTNGSDDVQNLLKSLNSSQKSQFLTSSNNGILGISGLNAKSYTGQDYKSTIYQRNVNQSSSVNYHTYVTKNRDTNPNGIVGFTNIETQNYGIQNQDNNPYTNESLQESDKNKMYNYSISESGKYSTISDAKDVYSYREKEKNYSIGSNLSSLSSNQQTLKNYRAEVLASSTDLVTKASIELQKNNTKSAVSYQKAAIEELIANTAMVAQTGVINSEIEYNRTVTQVYDDNSKQYVQNLGYHVQDVNLGLTERPRAQINVSKEITNIQVKLANGQTLFDANQSVSNLLYQKHKVYNENEYYDKRSYNGYVGYRLRQTLKQVVKERQEELIQATMDEELMSGATIRLTYNISVKNIGEVDYLDKSFYYLGKTNNNSGQSSNWVNVVKTNAMNVLDYVSNEIDYEENYQDDKNNWRIVTADVLLGTTEDKKHPGDASYNEEDNDYVNSAYKGNLDTFNVLITTNKLSAYLIPMAIDTDKDSYANSSREVSLILSTLLSNTTSSKNLIFTNMVELIESRNTFGRRMNLSKSGNHYVPYQSENKTEDESTYWLKPNEPDEDSGQKVIVTVPTGKNKNYNRAIVLAISALAIIAVAIIFIKKKVINIEHKK